MSKIIRGAGSQPSPPKPPEIAPDSLNSKQFATLQDLLSEGEIEGSATASKAGLTKNTTAYNNAFLKDIFLDNVPILDSQASNTAPQPADFNFQNIRLTPRFGTSSQGHVPGIELGNNENVIPITTNNKPTNPAGTTASGEANAVNLPQITNSNVDAAKITISVPILHKIKKNGDLVGTDIQLKIQIQYQGGGYDDAITDTITGRTGDLYQRQYRITFDQTKIDTTNPFSVDIRVVRLTIDSDDADKLKNEFLVATLGEVVDDKQRYLNSAYTHLTFDSEQFSRIPKRVFRIRGVKVRIPGAGANVVSATYTQSTTVVTINNNNHGLSVGDKIFFDATSGNGVDGTYTIQTVPDVNSFTITSGTSQTVGSSNCTFTAIPRVDLQTGRIIYPEGYIFNGTLQAATWCSCPAMILLDLLTSERYGFGTHVSDSNVDIYSLVTASKYANALVPDGFNGQEARFSCNVNIQGAKEAYKLINELAGVMRSFPIWQTGAITFTQDSPADPSYIFSLANVGEGGFSYSGSSLKRRHSLISVSYLNLESREIDYEVVQDDAAITKFGIVKKSVNAFACTSRGQAQRLGKAILFSEQQESEVVTFTTSIDAGAIVRPGSVISINDPVRSDNLRQAGRVKAVSADKKQITVDNTLDLSAFTGGEQEFRVLLPDGTLEKQDITGVDSTTGVITLASALSQTPNANTMWLIQSLTRTIQTFRVITVEEQDSVNYTITALTYIPAKYDNIDSDVPLPARSVSLLSQLKDPPSSLQVSERVVTINALAVSKLFISWSAVRGVSQYLVQYRYEKSNWVSQIVLRTDFEIFNTEQGTYEIKVFSYNALLVLSSTSTNTTFIATGKNEPPDAVETLSMEPLTNKLIRLRWTQSTNPDVIHGGRVYVRHSNKTDGSGTFQDSVDLIPALAGNTTEAICPSIEGEYIVKFRDDQGNFSKEPDASIILDLPDLIDSQQILSIREDPNFTGTTSSSNVVAQNTILKLTDPAVSLTGTYNFANTIDLGGVFSLNLERLIQSIGFALGGETVTATYVRTTATISGQSQTVIEVTSNSHGRSVGDYVDFTALTGGATSGVFEIKAVSTNTFQFLASGSAISSSNCTFAFVNTIDALIPSGSLWDDYAVNGNFDGPKVNDTTASISVRTTPNDPSSSPTYTQFNNFVNGTYKARAFQFKLDLETENPIHNIAIQQLGLFASFEARTERSYKVGNSTSIQVQNNLDSNGNAASKTVEFAHPFFVGTASLGGLRAFMPSIGITIENAQSGDFFTVTQPTNSDAGKKFTVDIKNGSNFVNRNFTFQAVGYGKGV